MKPEDVTHGSLRWVVVSGDSRDVLPRVRARCARLALTDPPYGISRDGAKLTRPGAAALSQDFGEWDRDAQEVVDLIRLVLTLVGPVVTADGAAHVFTSDRLFGAVREAVLERFQAEDASFSVWCKSNPAPSVRKRDPISAAELLVFGRRAGNPFHLPQRHRDGFNWLQAPIVHDAHRLRTAAGAKHPNQKPVALLEKLIRRSTDPGDLVIDPFSGTGAVGEAALRTGRRFLGVEIDPDWVQASRKHLAAVEAELAGGPTARKPARRPRRAPAPAPTAAPAEESDAAAAQAYSVTAILGPARTRRASRAPAAEVAPAALAPLENPPAPTT